MTPNEQPLPVLPRRRYGWRVVPAHPPPAPTTGFTLLELLVVLAVIGILAAGLSGVMAVAVANGRRSAGASNLRQLFLANEVYAVEHGHYAPAAADIFGSNRQRWHGTRPGANRPFDGRNGPLSPYLGDGQVRRCPGLRNVRRGAAFNAFEESCGGYGYNFIGVGSQIYRLGFSREALTGGMRPEWIADPAHTVMFADSAFPQPYGNQPRYLIEYSFVEPYHWVFAAGRESSFRADPSIHFRHRGRANVVWCDGHVSSERMETRAEDHFTRWDIGWFGPPDNRLFDPYPSDREGTAR